LERNGTGIKQRCKHGEKQTDSTSIFCELLTGGTVLRPGAGWSGLLLCISNWTRAENKNYDVPGLLLPAFSARRRRLVFIHGWPWRATPFSQDEP
jgi:hypothetical protein